MPISRFAKIATGVMVLIVAGFLVGIQLSTAGNISPAQLLLTGADLPVGARVQMQTALTPGSQGNGFVNEDGTDIVHGYIDGARVEYLVPLAQGINSDKNSTLVNSYIANGVYRFSDKQVAASEYQRLKKVFSDWAVPADYNSLADHQSVTFEIASDSEAPAATMRWLFVQRDQFLIVLAMPGPLQVSPSKLQQNGGSLMTTEEAADYNRAVDDLFAANVSLLQRR
jgi:hypothetical protein